MARKWPQIFSRKGKGMYINRFVKGEWKTVPIISVTKKGGKIIDMEW